MEAEKGREKSEKELEAEDYFMNDEDREAREEREEAEHIAKCNAEWNSQVEKLRKDLHKSLIALLTKHELPGSCGGRYSLYTALDDELDNMKLK